MGTDNNVVKAGGSWVRGAKGGKTGTPVIVSTIKKSIAVYYNFKMHYLKYQLFLTQKEYQHSHYLKNLKMERKTSVQIKREKVKKGH